VDSQRQRLGSSAVVFSPTIGHTALMAVAMLWLVPVSAVVGFLLFVAAIAN
jgi:hypothetical protein